MRFSDFLAAQGTDLATVAARVDVQPLFLQRVNARLQPMPVSLAARIAQALGVPLADVLAAGIASTPLAGPELTNAIPPRLGEPIRPSRMSPTHLPTPPPRRPGGPFIWFLLSYGGLSRMSVLDISKREIVGEIDFGETTQCLSMCYCPNDTCVTVTYTDNNVSPVVCGIARIDPVALTYSPVFANVESSLDNVAIAVRPAFEGPVGSVLLATIDDLFVPIAKVTKLQPDGTQTEPYVVSYPNTGYARRFYQESDLESPGGGAEGVMVPCTFFGNTGDFISYFCTYDQSTGSANQQEQIALTSDFPNGAAVGFSLQNGGQIAYSPNQTTPQLLTGGLNGMTSYPPDNFAGVTTFTFPSPDDAWAGGVCRVNAFDSPTGGEPPCEFLVTYTPHLITGSGNGVLALCNSVGTISASVVISDYSPSAKVIRESSGPFTPNTDDAVWVEVVGEDLIWKIRRYVLTYNAGDPTHPTFVQTDEILLNNPDGLPIQDLIRCPLGPTA